MSSESLPIPVGISDLADPRELVASLQRQLSGQTLSGVVVFCDPEVSRRPQLGALLREAFGEVPVIGCTTAGELHSAGYATGQVIAIGFPRADFAFASARLSELKALSAARVKDWVGLLEEQLQRQGHALGPRCFGLLLADGLSGMEERLALLLHGAIGALPVFGGSAGDGLQFGQTGVLFDGEFAADAAALVVISTTRPFRVLKTQHFEPTGTKLVVTGADVAQRIVTELNGYPAAEEFARVAGVSVDALSPSVFAQHPLMLRMGGQWYVRSIQRVLPDGALKVYCAVDEGLVLTVGRGTEMVDDLERQLETACAHFGAPRLVLGCDCILRRIEAQERGLSPRMAKVFERFHVVGFSTYGEQLGAAHINQTFTGVAIG